MSRFRASDTRVHPGELDSLASALRSGQILVDSAGQVVWIDPATRERLNGELKDLDLSEVVAGPHTVECRAAPADVTINGKRFTVCVIQKKDNSEVVKNGPDLLTAVEAVMADSATWFTRTVLEKIRSIRQAQGSGGHTAQHPSDLEMLSEREREVLGFICEGRSDLQMSEALDLSQNTVRNHIASLYRKIGVNRRSAAVIWARERGITGCEGPPRKSRRSLAPQRAKNDRHTSN